MKNSESRLAKKLLDCQVAIDYQPLRDEPKPIFVLPPVRFTISPDTSADPVDTAKQVSTMFPDSSVCVYVPGTAFDSHGTRHGRGGGWYDRFLASVPSHWLRVGLCFEDSFSHDSIKREPWDQSMDWVCVTDGDEVSWYETNARNLS